MLFTYTKYLVNGFIITLLAWVLQYSLFYLIGDNHSMYYSVASALAMIITTTVNYYIQKKLIFKAEGLVAKFVVVEFLNVISVSVAVVYVRDLLLSCKLNHALIDLISFPFVALVISVPVFILKRFWVFMK